MPKVEGPVLEIGSRVESNTQPYRPLFPGIEYVGVDMQDGTNVDFVIDLTEGIGDLEEEHFELIICASVLEHVKYPWLFAENVTKLARPGGFLYLSVPWIWRYHMYPDDYFRYSPSGVKVLFPGFEWKKFYASTRKIGEIYEIANFKGFDKSIGLQPMMVNSLGLKIESGREEKTCS